MKIPFIITLSAPFLLLLLCSCIADPDPQWLANAPEASQQGGTDASSSELPNYGSEPNNNGMHSAGHH